MALPSELERRLVERLFAEAAKVNWADCLVTERSAHYAEWVADPEIGGVLATVMPLSQARVWIKEGPMKEWARAKAGVGRYAKYMDSDTTLPEDLVRAGLGPEWGVEKDSLRTKPLRIRASDGNSDVVFAWGPDRDLKHLIWAALQAGAVGETAEWVVCVVDSFTKPVPANVRKLHQRIAARCQVRLVHATI